MYTITSSISSDCLIFCFPFLRSISISLRFSALKSAPAIVSNTTTLLKLRLPSLSFLPPLFLLDDYNTISTVIKTLFIYPII